MSIEDALARDLVAIRFVTFLFAILAGTLAEIGTAVRRGRDRE